MEHQSAIEVLLAQARVRLDRVEPERIADEVAAGAILVDMVLMPDKVIRCRFDRNHECFPVASMTSAGPGPTTKVSTVKYNRS
jgi:hypothetical protein